MGQINDLVIKVAQNAHNKGFRKKGELLNFGERIALIHSELSEALEADREGKNQLDDWSIIHISCLDFSLPEEKQNFQKYKEYVGFELADAIIRILDTAEERGLDMEWYITTKMRYNESREYMHGKKY